MRFLRLLEGVIFICVYNCLHVFKVFAGCYKLLNAGIDLYDFKCVKSVYTSFRCGFPHPKFLGCWCTGVQRQGWCIQGARVQASSGRGGAPRMRGYKRPAAGVVYPGCAGTNVQRQGWCNRDLPLIHPLLIKFGGRRERRKIMKNIRKYDKKKNTLVKSFSKSF